MSCIERRSRKSNDSEHFLLVVLLIEDNMYRGLATRQQMTDRLGLNRNAFNAASNTSNAEYGGWFSLDSLARPTFPRAQSETVWGKGSTNIEDAGLIQLLKQADSVTAAQSNSLNPVNTKLNYFHHSDSDRNSEGAHNATIKSSLQANGRIFELSNEQNTRPDYPNQSFENHLKPPSNLPEGHSSSSSVDQFSRSDAISKTAKYAVQRSYNYQSPSPRGQLQSNQLKKSATTLDLLSGPTLDGSDAYQTIPYVRHGPDTYANRISCNIPGTGPSWRNRWSQNRLQYSDPGNRQGHRDVLDRRNLPLSVDGLCRSDGSLVTKSMDFTNMSERSTDTTDPTALCKEDEFANGHMANRFRQTSERINAKLDQVDLQTRLARQKQGSYQNLGDENKQKFGRFGNMDNINTSAASQPKLGLLVENFRLNGTRDVVPLVGLSQQEALNRIRIYSDVVSSNKPTPRDGHPTTTLNDTRYTFSVNSDLTSFPNPKKSILKKPKVYSSDMENGLYARRRMDTLVARHSAGPVSCFAGLNDPQNSLGNNQQDSNQKRVTFNLNQ